MPRLFIIHWNAKEAEGMARDFSCQGWNIAFEAEDGARAGKLIKQEMPDVVAIYLTRLPSHGRETAASLRAVKATSRIPIVFVDGSAEAVAKARSSVSDAIFATSNDLCDVLSGF